MNDDSPVAKLVYLILLDGLKKGATEVDFEPLDSAAMALVGGATFRVIYRLAGGPVDAIRPPVELREALIARLKQMAQLDAAVRDAKQAGGFRLRLGGVKEVDFTIAFYPTPAGERVVIELAPATGSAQPN